jgi:hypothetical protein
VAGLDDDQHSLGGAEEHLNGWDDALAVSTAGEEANAAAH